MEQRKYQIQKQNIKKDLLEKIIGISYILMMSIILGVCLFGNNIVMPERFILSVRNQYYYLEEFYL